MGTPVKLVNAGKFYFGKCELERSQNILDIFAEQGCSLNISAVRKLYNEKHSDKPSTFESISKTLLMMALAGYLKASQWGRSRNFRLNPRRAKAS